MASRRKIIGHFLIPCIFVITNGVCTPLIISSAGPMRLSSPVFRCINAGDILVDVVK